MREVDKRSSCPGGSLNRGAIRLILQELWTYVVKPILDSLAFSVSHVLCREWDPRLKYLPIVPSI